MVIANTLTTNACLQQIQIDSPDLRKIYEKRIAFNKLHFISNKNYLSLALRYRHVQYFTVHVKNKVVALCVLGYIYWDLQLQISSNQSSLLLWWCRTSMIKSRSLGAQLTRGLKLGLVKYMYSKKEWNNNQWPYTWN